MASSVKTKTRMIEIKDTTIQIGVDQKSGNFLIEGNIPVHAKDGNPSSSGKSTVMLSTGYVNVFENGDDSDPEHALQVAVYFIRKIPKDER